MNKQPYSERTDIEKVESNWTKTLGLFARKEYSLSIIRAAVTAELALNYAIRQELHHKHNLPLAFVDKHLKWANGIKGKLDRLYVPILKAMNLEKQANDTARALKSLNNQRNDIAHRGTFRKKETAQQYVELAEKEINSLVARYDSDFALEKFEPNRVYQRGIHIPGAGAVQIPWHPEEDEQ